MLKTIKENDVLQWYRPPPLTTVLYLPGHPGAGAYTYDRSPCGNNGTITGAVWKKLPSGLWYLDFDMIDDQVALGSATTIDDITTGAGGTILAWIYPESDGEGDTGRIFFKTRTQFWVHSEAAGFVKLGFWRNFDGAANGNWATTNAVVPINTWSLVGVTYVDGAANDPIFYLNDTVPAVTETTTPVGNAQTDAASNAFIGGDGTGTTTFDGGIAIFRAVKGRVLSASEFAQIYQRKRHLFGV